MAGIQIGKTGLSPFLAFGSLHGRKSKWVCSDFDFPAIGKVGFPLKARRRFQVHCRTPKSDSDSNGEEPPESLFMKELRKRGMNPTSLLEDNQRSLYGDDIELKEKSGDPPKRNGVVSADYEKSLTNQREQSMALNSEGLEGLIPRARLLLTIGGTFFIRFWPLIVVIVTFFSALYLYFGPSFVHDASKISSMPPPYIDPYQLLEEERLSQSAPHIN